MKTKITLLLFLIPFIGNTQWSILGNTVDGVSSNDKVGFVNTIALDSTGGTMAIGSPFNSDSGSYSGYVKVFDLVAGTWTQRGNTFIGNDTLLEGTGSAVSLTPDGNTIAIGSSHGHNSLGYRCGIVRVFDWDGTDWIQRGAKIEGEGNANPLYETDVFGSSLSISSDGNYLAVGAPGNTQEVGVLQLQGQARVYHWDGSAWLQMGSDIDGIQSLEDFGRTISLNAAGDVLAVGGRDYGFPQDSGIVRVFDWDGTMWQPRGNFLFGPEVACQFGASVSLSRSGNSLVVGAPKVNNFAGGAFVYDWVANGWVQRGNTIMGSPTSQSGSSVDINGSGNIIAIGEPWRNSANGGAKVMSWSGVNWSSVENYLTGIGSTSAVNAFGSAVALDDWGAKIMVGASAHDAISFNEGKVYVFLNQVVIPSAGFSPDEALCMESITFTDASSALGTVSWMWNFGSNATPSSAVGAGPHMVSYSSDSAQTVTLIVSNAAASDTSTIIINPVPVPTAGFTHQATGVLVDFSNTSANATSYLWDFGSNNQSMATDPTFNFLAAGSYTVSLTATNTCGSDTYTESITVSFPNGEEELSINGLDDIKIYPNPAKREFSVDMPENMIANDSRIELYNSLGQQVYISELVAGNRSLLLPELGSGFYTVIIRFPKQNKDYRSLIAIH